MRKITTWSKPQTTSVFADMERIMDDMMTDFWAPQSWKSPFMGKSPLSESVPCALHVKLNISETDESFHVSAELPGLTEKDIQLSLEDGILTLQGEKSESFEEKHNYHRIEQTYGSFYRQVQLPKMVDEAKVTASFEQGILNITLPKQEDIKAGKKEIPILSK